VHAITEPDWLDEMASEIRRTVEEGREVHLVLEHDGNVAEHLRRDFDAQWNDDIHHVLHVMLTGEQVGYYEDYVQEPAQRLACSLAEGFIYQGEPSKHRGGAPRGSQSGDLLPTAFVFFLQNHDQIGNRAFGDRLASTADRETLEAAIVLQMLCPQIPLIFMGEEDASPSPFLFFTDHHGDLAEAVREGRRREFAKFPAFADPRHRAQIPDPNDEQTFLQSRPTPDPVLGEQRRELYRALLRIRSDAIVPRLKNACAIEAHAVGSAAVVARWRMSDGAVLIILVNLGEDAAHVAPPCGDLLFESRQGAWASARRGELPGKTAVACLGPIGE
jgi:maltooligosyltrehalose trehalohydrolase